MPGVTYFVQECPTCGRRLQIRVDYLGKRVGCRHCARFDARDPANALFDPSDSSTLLARADELLEAASSSGLGLDGSRGYTEA